MNEAYTFSDVQIPPQYSEVTHRSDVDLTTDFGAFKLTVPIFSANMKTITEHKMATAMSEQGAIGVLHRFGNSDHCLSEYMSTEGPCFVSIGVQESDKDLMIKYYMQGARLFCIDVAHGHHIHVKRMLKWIRTNYSAPFEKPCIIAGNVATRDGASALIDWGADIIKVGIGPGAACLTRKNVGVGVPQLYALEQIGTMIEEHKYNVKIIADGGITCGGDVNKALIHADGVMIGSLISGTTETPGKVFKDKDGKYYKVYMGSASGENKSSVGKSTDYIEGCAMQVPFKGKAKYIIRELAENIQMACSYVGAFNLQEYKQNVKQNGGWLYISDGARTESKY